MRSPDAATTRLDDYMMEMLPWAHGHPRKALRDFVQAIIAQPTGGQAQLARRFGNQEAATKRLSRLLHNERLAARHLACRPRASSRPTPGSWASEVLEHGHMLQSAQATTAGHFPCGPVTMWCRYCS